MSTLLQLHQTVQIDNVYLHFIGEETQAPRGEVIRTKFYSSHMRELWPYPGYLSPALLLLISMINFLKIWVKENVWSHK